MDGFPKGLNLNKVLQKIETVQGNDGEQQEILEKMKEFRESILFPLHPLKDLKSLPDIPRLHPLHHMQPMPTMARNDPKNEDKTEDYTEDENGKANTNIWNINLSADLPHQFMSPIVSSIISSMPAFNMNPSINQLNIPLPPFLQFPVEANTLNMERYERHPISSE